MIIAARILERLANYWGEVIGFPWREGRKDARTNAQRYPLTAAMAAHLKTERKRRLIDVAKRSLYQATAGSGRARFLQFSMRIIKKVSVEWKLVCIALNLRRIKYF